MGAGNQYLLPFSFQSKGGRILTAILMKEIRMNTPELQNIHIQGAFWNRILNLVRDVMIPYQWEALNDQVKSAEPSHAIQNFRIATGEETGTHGGYVFQDSDLYKWIEAAANSLAQRPDPALTECVDEVVRLIEKAQGSDGYVNTYFTLVKPEDRWNDLLNCHELYCAGHLIEAAVAYWEATKKDRLLNVACRLADHINSIFGPAKRQKHGYPGHPEIELALVRLYQATSEGRYLSLSQYFIDERGQQPLYYDSPNREYNQFHKPVREQETAVGHAVRALYLYAGMADIALYTGDPVLRDACINLWNDVTQRQMYITGGVGSTHIGEAFTFDYDLPNDTAYAETCASIALMLFAQRMFVLDQDRRYADVIERILYNILLASMQLDGHRFFYANPQELWPERVQKNPSLEHIKPVRQPWFGCACCPPNIARTLTGLGKYIYTTFENAIYVHQFIPNEATLQLADQTVTVKMNTDYPWDGQTQILLSMSKPSSIQVYLRMPDWCAHASLMVNRKNMDADWHNGYMLLSLAGKETYTIDFMLDMPAQFIQAHPNLRADAGKLALMRGPMVYCFEQADNGENLSALFVQPDTAIESYSLEDLPSDIVALKLQGQQASLVGWNNTLYRPYRPDTDPVTLIAVPYAFWGNRKQGEMRVWMNTSQTESFRV